MRKKVIVSIGALVLIATAWYFIFSEGFSIFDRQSVDGQETVALVNGEEISRADFEALRLQFAAQQGFDPEALGQEEQNQFKSQVIDILVSQTLLHQAAKEAGLAVSQEEINEQIEQIKAQFEGEESFQEALAIEGLSEEKLREQMSIELTIQNYLSRELELESIFATKEEIETFYSQAAAGQEDFPALEDVRDQVEGAVIQQKQQHLVSQLIQGLQEKAEIEILL